MSRSSLRSTFATSTSSISAAARQLAPEPTLQSDRLRLTLLDGSTFVVCDERGDVDGVICNVRLLRRGYALSVALGADDRRRTRRPGRLRAERAARRRLRAGMGDRVGGAARVVRRPRSRRGGNCLEPVRPRGGGGARARARLRLRRHLRGQARGGPRRAGQHFRGGAVATGAVAGRTHRRVRGRGLPGTDARASGPGARRGGRRRRALPAATRTRRAAGSSASRCSGS